MKLPAAISFFFLVSVGSLQMFGDVFGFPKLKGLGLATSASPAPKVFTAQQGFETYANRFFIEYQDEQGEQISLLVTPQIYRRLQGPYNRRNMYGAATSYGPVLAANPLTKSMLESVLHYAFCADAPLLKEFGVSSHKADSPVKIRLEPIGMNAKESVLQLILEAGCDEE